MLSTLITWVGFASQAAEAASIWWPQSWTNVEVRFLVEELNLGFQCDDKDLGWFRVLVVDANANEIVYMEGHNDDQARPEVGYNTRNYQSPVLFEMFQMARCKREHERTGEINFAQKYQQHRNRLVSLFEGD